MVGPAPSIPAGLMPEPGRSRVKVSRDRREDRQDSEKQSRACTDVQRRRLDGHGLGEDDGGRYELLTPDLTGSLEVVWVETQPGYDTAATPFRHHGEEFGLVISGRTIVHLDGVEHDLGPGDSIRYASTVPHWYSNPGPEVSRAVWVITPPTW